MINAPRRSASGPRRPHALVHVAAVVAVRPAVEHADSPDLGHAFEFREKTPGTLPGLSRVHCFCYPASVTHGSVSGDIPAISEGAKRLAQGIAGLLYQEDIDAHYAAIQAYAEPEIFGDEWTPAPPPSVEANATSSQEAAR